MMTRARTGAEALIEPDANRAAESAEIRTRRVRVRVKRKQDKFPRWVRLSLWLGLPVVLWIAVYLIGAAILRG
mgnify:CR=1 FL=1